MSEPFVVIAIVSTNEAHNIVNCLGALSESVHRAFRIVICENGGETGFKNTCAALATILKTGESSNEPTAATCWPSQTADFLMSGGQRVTVLHSKNRGYAGGVNACINAADKGGFDAVWVLNPDTFPEPEALSALVRRAREGGYGIVGSRIVGCRPDDWVQTWGGMGWRKWLGRGRALGMFAPRDEKPDIVDVERNMQFIMGASMYVSRDYIEQIGLMDEDFFCFCEDVDWSLRRGAFRLGYAHDSIVPHIHGATAGSTLDKRSRSRFSIYLNERNKILMTRKLFPEIYPIMVALALIQIFEYLVRVRSLRQFGFALDGFRDGVRGKKGPPPFLQPQ